MRCDLDDRGARTNRTAPCGLTGAAFSPIQVPLCPQPIEMANAHHNRDLTLRDLVEYYTAWTLRIFMEDLPHQGHLHDTQLSPSLKRWTCTLHEGRLAQGESHDFILLEICFRMKSALSPLEGNGYFYLQENQWVRLKMLIVTINVVSPT